MDLGSNEDGTPYRWDIDGLRDQIRLWVDLDITNEQFAVRLWELREMAQFCLDVDDPAQRHRFKQIEEQIDHAAGAMIAARQTDFQSSELRLDYLKSNNAMEP